MNGSILWRLSWKEYRLQRMLWISVAMLTTLLLAMEFVILDPPDKIPWMFWLALAFPALYPLGCGAMLFAGEHEAGTYDFQRSLPVEARHVFLVKMPFTFVNTAILFGLMWLLAAFLSDWKVPVDAQGKLPAMMGAFALLAFLWAVFFSLLLKHVLAAAVLGGIATYFSLLVVVGLIFRLGEQDATILSASIRIVAVAAIVALLDLRLGARWFRERGRDRSHSLLPTASSDTPTHLTVCDDRGCQPKARTIIQRLIWPHWRQAVGILVCFFAAEFFLFYTIMITRRISGLPLGWDGNVYAFSHTVVLSLSLVASVLGVCTFHADQNGSGFRFLTHRGVPPKHIWLSRQLRVLLPVVLVSSMLGLSFDLLQFIQMAFNATQPIALHIWPFVASLCLKALRFLAHPVILAICVGQLFSMFFRSAILAVLFSVLLTLVLAAWCGLMQAWQVNWWWSELPIPIALLLASRLRTRYWLLERNDWRAWLPTGLTLTVPAVVIFTCVAFQRAYEIPLVDPGFSPEEFGRSITAEERETRDLYQQLLISPTAETDQAYEGKIALATKASQGKLCPTEGTPFEKNGLSLLSRGVVGHAVKLEGQGKLDAAFDCYQTAIRISFHLRDLNFADDASRVEMSVYAHLSAWATHPGQTPERIVDAVRKLEQLTSNVSVINGIKVAYLRMQRAIEGDPNAMNAEKFPKPEFTTFWLRLPWERERALRLLNEQTRAELTAASDMEQAVRKGEWSFWSTSRADPSNRKWRGFIAYPSHSWLGIVIYGVPNPYDFELRDDNMKLDYAIQETSRRAIQLVLALEAWKLQHGSLPKTFSELVGPCLDRLPVDPFSGDPFCYFREGIRGHLPPVKFEWPYETVRTASRDIAPNTPFIWSTGFEARRIAHTGDILDQYQVCQGLARMDAGRPEDWHKPTSTYDLWMSGWPFPIP